MVNSAIIAAVALPVLASAQLITSSQLQSVPKPAVVVVPAGASEAATVTKRGRYEARDDSSCTPNPTGYGPTSSPDTADAFLSNPEYASIANAAGTPSGYTLNYQAQNAATSEYAYLTYKTYQSYDTSAAAADCASITNCQAFNMFFERDPVVVPAASCTNPNSTTYIKASFWGIPVTPASATNAGQWQDDFHVVIAGSNGYSLTQPEFTVPDFNGTYTGNATINSPTSCDSYITYDAHNSGAYDPNLCAQDCLNQRQENSSKTCRFFTSYLLAKNGNIQTQVCALYTETWGEEYAVNQGYYDGNDHYTILDAYSYSYADDLGTNTCSGN